MLDINRILKKTEKISDDLTHRYYDSIDRTVVILEVDYKKKKFVVEKSEQNNFDGREKLAKIAKDLDTEEKVRKHLNL